MITEEWRSIAGAPGYIISNYGNIVGMNGYQLKTFKNKKGYLVFSMPIKAIGTTFSRGVHRIVAIAFIPNPLNLPEVNHKDGNKENNYYENLEWNTTKQNINHAIKTGLRSANQNLKSNSIFDVVQVKVMKDAIKAGYRGVDIAKYFNCTRSTISKIKVGKHYPYIN